MKNNESKTGQIVIAARGDMEVLKLMIREIKDGHIFALDVKKDYNVYDITKWPIVPALPEEIEGHIFKKQTTELGIIKWSWRDYTIIQNALLRGYCIKYKGQDLFKVYSLKAAQASAVKHYAEQEASIEKVS